MIHYIHLQVELRSQDWGSLGAHSIHNSRTYPVWSSLPEWRLWHVASSAKLTVQQNFKNPAQQKWQVVTITTGEKMANSTHWYCKVVNANTNPYQIQDLQKVRRHQNLEFFWVYNKRRGPNLRYYGFSAATYEIADDGIHQDILNPLGFCFALSLCIRLFKEVQMGVSFAHQSVQENYMHIWMYSHVLIDW